MATKKINVRSPFYVQVNEQSPPSPTPPTPTVTLYQWGGVINYSDTVGTLKTDISSYTEAQLESEFICGECNGPSETSYKRSQYGYSQYKSNRLPMQVGDQVYDENGAALTVAATRGTIAYGIENGTILETGINPCQKSTATLLGQPVYKQYLSHIYTWDSSGIVTAVKVPESNCEGTNVIPTIPEDSLGCGELISIGKDVGTRIFNIDARNRIGNFTITHTFSVPVKILITVNGVQTDYGYRGYSNYAQDMINLGVPQSELTGLVSTILDSRNIVVNRTSEAFPSIKIELRILKELDSFGASLTSSCAADTSRNAAPTVSGTTGNLIENSEALIIEFGQPDYQLAGGVATRASAQADLGLEILINGTVVKSIANGSLDWASQAPGGNKSFVLTNIIASEYQLTPADNAAMGTQGYIVAKSPILVNSSSMNKGINKIGFRFTCSASSSMNRPYNEIFAPQVRIMSTAVFYNSTASTYKWADSRLHYHNSNYGLSEINTTPVRDFGKGGAIGRWTASANKIYELGYEIQKITSTQERHVPFTYPSLTATSGSEILLQIALDRRGADLNLASFNGALYS